VLVLLNLRKEAITVSLPSTFAGIKRTEYHLQSPDLTSKQIYLNGMLLSLNQDGTLPNLAGNPSSGGPIALASHSYAFVEMVASADICK